MALVPASINPIARVLPLTSVPMLDRYFDYYIRDEQDEWAQPGVRVRVPFAGQRIDAILIERRETTDFSGSLSFIEKVISPEKVYPPQLSALIDSLAQRYAGTRPDIIRTAIPARVAYVEKNIRLDQKWEELGTAKEPDLSSWMNYQHGSSFVDAVIEGKKVRAAWQAIPGYDWAETLASLLVKVAIDGGGVIAILPTARDVQRLEKALRKWVSAAQITVILSSLGNQARYRRYLDILHGRARIIIGTRSAAFAPVHNLRLMVIFNDGDENLVDPRAPYVHSREVVTTRSSIEQCSVIYAGYTRTAEVHMLVEHGWAHDLIAPAPVLMHMRPKIYAVDSPQRLPSQAFYIIRDALKKDMPVLVQVVRKGYVPLLSCAKCHAKARCRYCNGPLELRASSDDQADFPVCSWCGRSEQGFRCSECGHKRIQATMLGAERIAQELGAAFPGVSIVLSEGSRIKEVVSGGAKIVISTPGAEPVVEGGLYGALIITDSWAQLCWPDLRSTEQALAVWVRAASLVDSQGSVVITYTHPFPVIEDFIKWDMVAAARRELGERRLTKLPPEFSLAAIDAPASVVMDIMNDLEVPSSVELLGPVDLPTQMKLPGEYDKERLGVAQRIIVRAPAQDSRKISDLLRSFKATKSGRKSDFPLRIQMNPIHIG